MIRLFSRVHSFILLVVSSSFSILYAMEYDFEADLNEIRADISMENEQKLSETSCYICHAWSEAHDLEKFDDLFSEKLDYNLSQAGVITYFDRRKDERGAAYAGSIVKFIEKIALCDFYIIVCSETLYRKYNNNCINYISIEIGSMLDSVSTSPSKRIIPLWISGDRHLSIPVVLRGFDSVYFKDKTKYEYNFLKLLGKILPDKKRKIEEKSFLYSRVSLNEIDGSLIKEDAIQRIKNPLLLNLCTNILKKINDSINLIQGLNLVCRNDCYILDNTLVTEALEKDTQEYDSLYLDLKNHLDQIIRSSDMKELMHFKAYSNTVAQLDTIRTYITVSRISNVIISKETWIHLFTTEVLSLFSEMTKNILVLQSLTDRGKKEIFREELKSELEYK